MSDTLHNVVEGIEQVFAILPRSDLAIGNQRLHNLSFAVPVSPARNIPAPREDGILPTCGFRSVFISPSAHYADRRTMVTVNFVVIWSVCAFGFINGRLPVQPVPPSTYKS